MACHHALADALSAYAEAAGITRDRKGLLFRTSLSWRGDVLSELPIRQTDAWRMIRCRAVRREPPHRSVATRSVQQGLPPTSSMAGHWSMPRPCRHTKAREQRSSMAARAIGSSAKKLNGSGSRKIMVMPLDIDSATER